ncbi:ImmA/IrrE family metallo-endopeptidase [Agrobacterium rhizogenes]|nr:ImmA/IrrE family metallo-endopeptidase [Rhizobium rhizogenes]NTF79195.1 ImmA/IrrE family metallo-endopeptidase [Rhizobium rhizogenes]
MDILRMDLADTGSPEGLVSLILKHEPNLPLPVPIEELALQLEVEEIAELRTEGFEGGLITDTIRSRGIILVKKGVNQPRRRFTIGHELGHFLIANHIPDKDGQFLCSREDLRVLSAKEGDRRAKMEVEANRFSSLILMPPPRLREAFKKHPSPSLEHVFQLADQFGVSKEAMARAYAEYHPESLAFIVVKDGKVGRVYHNRKRFPFVVASRNRSVPHGSLFYQRNMRIGVPSEIDGRLPDLWIDVPRGQRAPALSEQVCLQNNGFALIMLWHESAEDEEEESEDMTTRDRWRAQQERYRRD